MLSLKDIQDAFTQNLMADDPSIVEHVIGTKKAPSELRMGIYGNAYRERLIEALTNDYEMLEKLLGEDSFRLMCTSYIEKYPSIYYSLRWFGKKFPEFLEYSPEKGHHDWEAELAQLEWQFIEAFDSANIETVSETDAAAIPPESWPTLSMDFHPSVKLLNLWWNTLDLWQAAKKDEQPPHPIRLPKQSHCLMWRNNLMTQYRSLEADEAVALSAALSGANFSEICSALATELNDQEQTPMKAASFLKGWLAAGMLIQLKT
ncbi:MAG: putative DNA-binding domain-containing protein [Gammaproteobacteria bacterium]|nr:putative DNA-binding domain-containing protein [Gammaproteobacteria bacterium]